MIKVFTESNSFKNGLVVKFKRLSEVWLIKNRVAEFDLAHQFITFLDLVL